MKKTLSFIFILLFIISCYNTVFAQIYPQRPSNSSNQYNYPNQPNSHNYPNQPYQPNQPNVPLPPKPPIKQDFPTKITPMNVGYLPTDGINLSANAGVMAENSFIEIKRLGHIAAIAEIKQNSNGNRFQPVSSLYEIKVKDMNQYSALPIKYAIMANGIIPNGSRLFMMVKSGNDVFFIPATATTSYGMVIAEISSCAIYEKIALIVDNGYNSDFLNSFMLSASLDSQNKPLNPHYATLTKEDGFAISAHIFPQYGRNSNFTSQTLTIIQPQTSASLSIYKVFDKEKVFVQKIPFTPTSYYSFCKIDLNNFEKYYDNNSKSYVIWIGFEDTNIEDIPNALIFRATCCDAEGIRYSTEDQLVYIALSQEGYSSPFSGGNGTSSNPYIITTVKQLDKVRDYKRCYFRLGCDINLNSYQDKNWLPIGDDEDPFNSLFDGNNKTIYNLSIKSPNENYQGLFGCIKNGSVKNLKIELSPEGVVADNYCGALAGYCSNARIFQCYSTGGSLKAVNYIGGLIGYSAKDTTIRKSISILNTSSDNENNSIGGLVGYSENTTISDCHTNVTITASGEKSSVGGIVAQGEHLKLQNCYSTGTIKTGKTGYAGGLVGYMNNCETKGCIALHSRIEGENQGRLAGKARNSSFIRCYAWEYIRDRRNKYISENGFGGSNATSNDINGESVAKKSFYGSNTRNKFWTQNKKVGFNLNSWIFNSGYNLPQLRNMPSLANPDYLR